MDVKPMDQILGKESPAKVDAPSPKPEPVKAEAAKELPNVETKPETEPEDEHPVPRKELIAERKKRQEYERKVAELESRFTQKQQPKPKDEDLDANFYSSPRQYVDQRLEQALRQERIFIGQRMMQSQHKDYAEMESVFVDAAKDNPALRMQLQQSDNPAQFAYEWAKNYSQVKDVGSLDAYAEKIRTEERAKFEAELKAKESAVQLAGVSKSVAGLRGPVPTAEGGGFTPTPLKSLVGARRGARS